jgi:hypothetical protein
MATKERRPLRNTTPWAFKLIVMALCGLAVMNAAETTRKPWFHRALQEDDDPDNQIIEGIDAPSETSSGGNNADVS